MPNPSFLPSRSAMVSWQRDITRDHCIFLKSRNLLNDLGNIYRMNPDTLEKSAISQLVNTERKTGDLIIIYSFLDGDPRTRDDIDAALEARSYGTVQPSRGYGPTDGPTLAMSRGIARVTVLATSPKNLITTVVEIDCNGSTPSPARPEIRYQNSPLCRLNRH